MARPLPQRSPKTRKPQIQEAVASTQPAPLKTMREEDAPSAIVGSQHVAAKLFCVRSTTAAAHADLLLDGGEWSVQATIWSSRLIRRHHDRYVDQR